MIEYKYTDNTSYTGWLPVSKDSLSHISNLSKFTLSFDNYVVRINGVQYTENSEEFLEVMAKEILWAKIKYG